MLELHMLSGNWFVFQECNICFARRATEFLLAKTISHQFLVFFFFNTHCSKTQPPVNKQLFLGEEANWKTV